MKKTRIAISGGAGYAGGELLRLLLSHPKVEVAAVSSSTYPGQPIHKAHPNLRGGGDLNFVPAINPAGIDCLFLAEGHGKAMSRLPGLLKNSDKGMKIVDLSGDFRLKDHSLYPAFYGMDHASPDLLGGFVYGLPELDRKSVASAAHVVNQTAAVCAITEKTGHASFTRGSLGFGIHLAKSNFIASCWLDGKGPVVVLRSLGDIPMCR